MEAALATETVSTEQRKSQLARSVANNVRKGWRIESQTDYQAVMVKGNRTNHVLHLILSILTLGVWLIVWALVALMGGEKRMVVEVDEYGQVLQQH